MKRRKQRSPAVKSKRPGGSPPLSGRFKPGQSGNPAGRPKGRKNLATLFAEAAGQKFDVVIRGKTKQITAAQSAIMQLANKAAKGDTRAIERFINYLDEFERRAEAARPQPFPFSEADQDMIRTIYERMQQSKPAEGR